MPLTFVAGYLGAGKTTLINEVLATTDRPVAVFVNDVGEIDIDARLIRRRHGDTIELTDGCVCCSLSDGFGAAFDQIRERDNPPDHLIVELSGVADPSRVLPWSRSAGFVLDGVVTVVDVQMLDERAGDPVVRPLMDTQIANGDIVVLTKGATRPDLTADAHRRVDHLTGGRAPIVESTDAAAMVLRVGGRGDRSVVHAPEATLFDSHVTELVPLPVVNSPDELEGFLDRLPADVVRAKGIAADSAGRRWVVHRVGSRVDVALLPDAEEEPATELVAIRIPRSVAP